MHPNTCSVANFDNVTSELESLKSKFQKLKWVLGGKFHDSYIWLWKVGNTDSIVEAKSPNLKSISEARNCAPLLLSSDDVLHSTQFLRIICIENGNYLRGNPYFVWSDSRTSTSVLIFHLVIKDKGVFAHRRTGSKRPLRSGRCTVSGLYDPVRRPCCGSCAHCSLAHFLFRPWNEGYVVHGQGFAVRCPKTGPRITYPATPIFRVHLKHLPFVGPFRCSGNCWRGFSYWN